MRLEVRPHHDLELPNTAEKRTAPADGQDLRAALRYELRPVLRRAGLALIPLIVLLGLLLSQGGTTKPEPTGVRADTVTLAR